MLITIKVGIDLVCRNVSQVLPVIIQAKGVVERDTLLKLPDFEQP